MGAQRLSHDALHLPTALAWRAVVHFGIGLADLFLSTAWWSSLSDTRVNSFGDSRGLDFLVVSVWSERRALERTGDERLLMITDYADYAVTIENRFKSS